MINGLESPWSSRPNWIQWPPWSPDIINEYVILRSIILFIQITAHLDHSLVVSSDRNLGEARSLGLITFQIPKEYVPLLFVIVLWLLSWLVGHYPLPVTVTLSRVFEVVGVRERNHIGDVAIWVWPFAHLVHQIGLSAKIATLINAFINNLVAVWSLLIGLFIAVGVHQFEVNNRILLPKRVDLSFNLVDLDLHVFIRFDKILNLIIRFLNLLLNIFNWSLHPRVLFELFYRLLLIINCVFEDFTEFELLLLFDAVLFEGEIAIFNAFLEVEDVVLHDG